jgi:hypothetical protein
MSDHPAEGVYCKLFVGTEIKVPLLNGGETRYINFDNAASTPPLLAVQQAVNDFLPYYSSVHRGTGFKSQLSTHLYEEARRITLKFLGADPQVHTCIFGKNTTEAINKLARRFPFTADRNIVLTSAMEHHSNDLPWRAQAEVIHIGLQPDGRLDLDDYEALLEQYADRVALVNWHRTGKWTCSRSMTLATWIFWSSLPIRCMHRMEQVPWLVGGMCLNTALRIWLAVVLWKL